jgi:hypothetical protein
MSNLIDQFFSEEIGIGVKNLILDAVAQHRMHGVLVKKLFEFNRFDLTLDFEAKTALIEDILASEKSGAACIKLDEFLNRLDRVN